jgi:hypothetical protein
MVQKPTISIVSVPAAISSIPSLDPYTIYSAIMNRRITTSTLMFLLSSRASAWLSPSAGLVTSRSALNLAGNNHGEGACFLPLEQMESDYYAPRIVQVSV